MMWNKKLRFYFVLKGYKKQIPKFTLNRNTIIYNMINGITYHRFDGDLQIF